MSNEFCQCLRLKYSIIESNTNNKRFLWTKFLCILLLSRRSYSCWFPCQHNWIFRQKNSEQKEIGYAQRNGSLRSYFWWYEKKYGKSSSRDFYFNFVESPYIFLRNLHSLQWIWIVLLINLFLSYTFNLLLQQHVDQLNSTLWNWWKSSSRATFFQ